MNNQSNNTNSPSCKPFPLNKTLGSEDEGIFLPLKDSGTKEKFNTGAQRDNASGKGRFDLLPVSAIERLAKMYEAGCLKYGHRNWEKGMPISRFMDSALRHMFKYVRGDDDEDHLVAAAWNVMCAMDTEERAAQGTVSPELLDLPRHNHDTKV